MTVRLVLVAHASTAATQEARFSRDEPLDARGREMAAAAETPRRFDLALRGPEKRCEETATTLGLQAAAHPSLADLDLSGWRGRTLTSLEAEHPAELGAWLTDPSATPHGGESLSALVDRVSGWLNSLAPGPTRIVAVTHPAVVRAAVLHALGAPLACFWRLDVAPLTQTRLSHHSGRWQLRETGHPLAERPAT
jgi:broad specificity phosphatase PhoE